MARNPERRLLSFINSKVINDVENLKLLKTRIGSNDVITLRKLPDEYYKAGKCLSFSKE